MSFRQAETHSVASRECPGNRKGAKVPWMRNPHAKAPDPDPQMVIASLNRKMSVAGSSVTRSLEKLGIDSVFNGT
jgi:hypothetical protein